LTRTGTEVCASTFHRRRAGRRHTARLREAAGSKRGPCLHRLAAGPETAQSLSGVCG